MTTGISPSFLTWYSLPLQLSPLPNTNPSTFRPNFSPFSTTFSLSINTLIHSYLFNVSHFSRDTFSRFICNLLFKITLKTPITPHHTEQPTPSANTCRFVLKLHILVSLYPNFDSTLLISVSRSGASLLEDEHP